MVSRPCLQQETRRAENRLRYSDSLQIRDSRTPVLRPVWPLIRVIEINKRTVVNGAGRDVILNGKMIIILTTSIPMGGPLSPSIRKKTAIILRIHDHSQAQLTRLVQARNFSRLVPSLTQRRQQHRRQNGNNRNHEATQLG